MKNIISTITTLGVSAMLVTLTGCDALNLKPIDNYGEGNYWEKTEHALAYMDGLEKNMRDHAFNHQFILGEARGGACKLGTGVDGSSLAYEGIIANKLTQEDPGITKFGKLYGYIANVNIFIQKVKEATYIPEAQKNYFLGQAYGLRAFYYFDLYRAYGSTPLRLDPNKVFNGNIDPQALYGERASASVIMKQIKADIDESMQRFGDNKSFDPLNRGNKKSYWSKAATEYLAAEVYLWNSKVTIGDNTAKPSDVTIAKQHLMHLMNDYNLSLMDHYSDVFSVNHKGNQEVILAARFMEGEQTNPYPIFLYNMTTGAWGTTGFNDEQGKAMGDTLQINSPGINRVEYRSEYFFQYDKMKDSRRDANFLSAYSRTDNQFLGAVFKKIMGHYDASTNKYIFDADIIIYRLAGVYLMMAEVENQEGGDVAKYINMVRKRAYGKNWDKSTDAYVNGDYTQNELAILLEKDKEMLSEGQRWYDLCRMTLTKGGEHLIFTTEGNKGAKLPILNKATEAHKVLWPVETEILNKDPKLTQTPGY